MPPPLAPGTRVGGRDRWSAWFIHSLRSIWDRVGAQLARRRPGWFSGQVESSRLPTDRYSAAPTPDGWAARGAGHAYDQTVDRLTNPISMRQAGQETPICTPQQPGAQPARRQVQFIMVVAADPCWGQAIAQKLAAQSYLVLTAGSVREASEKLVIEPALLILDASLPDASGWDLLDWLARCGREVPVMMIAPREPGVPRRARLRPILVLPPPVALETLIAIVQEHLLAPETAYGA